ncbi:uncharacterized protein LOC115887068 [Sitophilus oryzae]|uniref:Uncharacterized protein LOC115887068 n=1 Tax=Sitophilus oryzae TaxID=7048 RepID=A0A6J2YEC7_SITOR|nr:uncharacterized protein LOC115887068 [Sitophilus oryzae]
MELEAEATQSLIRAETAKIDAKRRERRQSRLAAQRDEPFGSRCPASLSQPGASSIGAAAYSTGSAYGAGYGGAQATSSGTPMSERTVQRTLTTVQENDLPGHHPAVVLRRK